MKHSPKSNPPSFLTDFINTPIAPGSTWTPDYSSFREKPNLREHLLKEQGYVCAYCGRGIDTHSSHIEHFYCQQHYPERSLDFENLFASCDSPPASEDGEPNKLKTPKTCGIAKGGNRPPDPHILPSDTGSEERFKYGLNGDIRPHHPEDAAAINMIQYLNLNETALKIERKRIIEGIDIDFETDAAEDKIIEISAWKTKDKHGKLKSFCQVASRYIEENY